MVQYLPLVGGCRGKIFEVDIKPFDSVRRNFRVIDRGQDGGVGRGRCGCWCDTMEGG